MYKDDEYFNGNIDTEFLSRDCEGFEEENEYRMRGNGNAPVKQMPAAFRILICIHGHLLHER